MTAPSCVSLQWTTPPPKQRHRTGVSLHSHTLHSKESLDFIYKLAKGVPVLASAIRHGERRYALHHSEPLDLSRAWWTPPLGPHDAFKLEQDQVNRMGLDALVSLTDHDDMEAPVSLHVLDECRDVPISVEWTVPFRETFFHLGIHNLAPAEARMFHAEMERYRKHPAHARPDDELLGTLLSELAARPRTLVVFNHPLWDESGIGADRHLELTRAFLRRFGPYIHAMELNGFRPWRENRNVLALAAAASKPLISGGDRHTNEPNSMLNLTNAGSFAEFVEEVRAGWSEVLILNHYRQSYAMRVFHNLVDALRAQERHSLGWKLWSDRAFYLCDDGRTRSFTELFGASLPLPVAVFLAGVRFAAAPQVQWILNGALQPGEEVIL